MGLYAKQAVDGNAQTLHGLASCAEWTGVKLSILLDEADVDQSGQWLLAEGADAAGMLRSIPMKKAMDDAMVALYQNRRAPAAIKRLPDTAPLARLRGQYERQVAATAQSYRRTDNDARRDFALHHPAAKR